MKNYLIIFFTFPVLLFSQAKFSGNVYDADAYKTLTNAKIYAITGTDTTIVEPDSAGNFTFSVKPGRTKIYAEADGYITELNSINAGDKSFNKLKIAMNSETTFTALKKDKAGRRDKILTEEIEMDDSKLSAVISVRGGRGISRSRALNALILAKPLQRIELQEGF